MGFSTFFPRKKAHPLEFLGKFQLLDEAAREVKDQAVLKECALGGGSILISWAWKKMLVFFFFLNECFLWLDLNFIINSIRNFGVFAGCLGLM